MSKTKKRFLILLITALLLSVTFFSVFFAIAKNNKVVAEMRAHIVAPLNYVGTSWDMYSNMLLHFDGSMSEKDGVIYTNTSNLKFTWTKVSTSFTALHNMGISSVYIAVYSDSYASGVLPIATPYVNAPKFATRLENEVVYDNESIAEGRYRITWRATFESFGTEISPKGEKYIVVDRTAPAGYFTGASNDDFVDANANIAFHWTDAPIGQAPISATLNGNNYAKSSRISPDGNQGILLSDCAGNSSSYWLTFHFDLARPYISNIDSIKSAFNLSAENANKLRPGQNGDLVLDIGSAVPGVEFSFVDNSTAGNLIGVTVTQNLFTYNLKTGQASGSGQTSYSATSNIKLDKPGDYQITVTDKFSSMLRLNFSLRVDTAFSQNNFVQKSDRYVLGNESLANIISIGGNNASAYIQIDGADIPSKTLTLQMLKDRIASKPVREKVAVIKVVSRYNGVEVVYFNSQICLDFETADIHNLRDLNFNGGSGSYLGTAKPGFYFEFGGLAYELDERAELIQTLYEYDSRNILFVKEEERKVDYASGSVLNADGYYVLKINDGYRITEFSFKIQNEFKSRNEYMLGNEYFIAPTYNAVKFPLSFGTFNILDDSNIDTKYIGKYFADKKYLFSSTMQTAYDFAFASEYSVCVQRTSNGYLYRARNQGIQVAYNDFAQLKTKIKAVVKEYVNYKSMKLTDSNFIDYTSTVIMDEELKQNGRYENVDVVDVGGISYNKIMLINKDFVFNFNAGKDAQSGKAKIVVTNLETSQTFNVSSGMIFGDFSTINGIYKVEEVCPGSSETIVYYVYLDNVAPTANISSAKATGVVINQTISAADTIVLQVEEFKLISLFDLIDNFCLAYISGYGFSDAIPFIKGVDESIVMSSNLGHKGTYEIEVYDRSKNKFSFTVYIMSQEPTATFAKSGSGDTEHVILDIQTADKYCTIIDLKIYRNQTSINSGELIEDDNGQGISFAVYNYIFKKGGRYKVVIMDNYERQTTIELRYIKDMPNISAEGLNKERRVNKEIKITIPFNCLFIIYAEKGSIFVYDIINDTINNQRIITIKPRNEYNELVNIDDIITIKAWFESDPDSYNDLSYYLDTIAPKLDLTNDKGEEVDGSLFKCSIKLKFDGDIKTIDVTRNGKYFSYTLGQTIRIDGQYSAVGKDIAGNMVVREFVVDMIVDFVIAYENNKKYNSSTESGVVVAQGFLITPNEQMNISATKDGFVFDYLVIDKIVTAGLYEINLVDNAGNIIILKLRVLSGIEGVGIHNEDGSLLSYNSTTRQSIYFVWQELSYIKSVTYKLNSNMAQSDYIQGDLIIKSGAYSVTVTDCVGNMLEIKCRIDKEVSVEIKLDKSAILEEIAGLEHLLTLRFQILVNESGLVLTIKKDGIIQQYTVGTWIGGNGSYEIEAEDEVGNIFKKCVTVIGESSPNLDIKTTSGTALKDKDVVNESIVISWEVSNYLSKVFVNLEAIKSGDKFVKDGRYRIEITDKLGRDVLITVTIKSQIGYDIKFSGEFIDNVEGKQITLTRGFSFSSSDTLEIVATLDGERFVLVNYRNYSLPGEYFLTLKDVAGNIKSISINVVGQAFLPNIFKSNDVEILNNSIINSGFYITKNKYIYTIKVNDVLYVDGIILLEGKNKIDVEDVIGYKTTLYITVDTKVKYTISYGKTFNKLNYILTDKFLITPNEELTITILFNGQQIEYAGKNYTASGRYEIEFADALGNSARESIEVDNRAPKVRIKNVLGEDILSNVINQIFVLSWGDDDNISQVIVNGLVVQNGARFESDGVYDIRITSLLDKLNTQTITINHRIAYELYIKNNISYEYAKDEVNYILAMGFSLSGNQISNIDCTFEGQKIIFEKGKTYISSGEYKLIITDTAGNVATLNMVISDKAIASGIAVGDQSYFEDMTTNKDFSILQNEFVAQINVNGNKYIDGAILQNEGKHTIEYIDVLGRKSYQIIKVDKSVTIDFEYSKIKNVDGLDIYLHNKLMLAPRENLHIEIFLDGKKIEVLDITKPITISGIYTVNATDDVGNTLCITILVDNVAPNIQTIINSDNTVTVSIDDATDMVITVHFDGKLLLENVRDFVLNKDGKYTISVDDELKNKVEKTINVDMAVDVSYNFMRGQSINFKPTFSFNELINYELYFEDKQSGTFSILKDYKINSVLVDKGSYLIKLKDERNNVLEIRFVYHGTSAKLAATQYHLPTIDGVTYKVLFENQPIEVVAENGVLNLNKTGKYQIIFTISNKDTTFYLEILSTPPSVTLLGKFKNASEWRAHGEVKIDTLSEFKLYFNGKEVASSSTVSKVGKYKVIATDAVGNTKEMEFEIYYKLNGWSWMLIVFAVIIALTAVMMILKRKGLLRIKINTNKKEERKNELD